MWPDGSCRPVPPVLDHVNRISVSAAAGHFDHIFAGEDVRAIGRSIQQAASLIEDWEWVFCRVENLLDRPEPEIRIEALRGLGVLVRENAYVDLDASEALARACLACEDLQLRELSEQLLGNIGEARLRGAEAGN